MVAGAGDAWTWADEGVGLWMSRAMEAGGRWRAERKSPPLERTPPWRGTATERNLRLTLRGAGAQHMG